MRRLLLLTSAIIFLDVAFYAAISPLLPQYADDLDLSKAQAGILAASYAAGTLLASLPAGYVAARVGPRRTVIGGLLLLGVSSLAFGFADQYAFLASARFIQGISSALTWAGAFTWLVSSVGADRRGAVIGTTIGTAVFGALFGPPIGALATAVGTEPVFGSVLAITLLMAWAAARIPDATEPEEDSLRTVMTTLTSAPVMAATAMIAVPSLMFGTISVLVPLRIDDLGGSAGLIAAGFTGAAAIEAVLAPAVGRYSDRIGRLQPYLAGIAISALGIGLFAAAAQLGFVFVALLVTSIGGGICFVPATTMLSDSAEASGLHQGFAAGLFNMAWAAGQVAGGAGGGGAASAFGNAAPCLGIAILLLATALLAWRIAPTLMPRPATQV
jgi:MFS family permease